MGTRRGWLPLVVGIQTELGQILFRDNQRSRLRAAVPASEPAQSLISAFCVNKHGPKCGPAGRSPRLAARFLSGAGRRQEASPTMPQKGHGRRPGICGASVTGLAGEVERVRRLGGQDRGLGRARKDRGRGSLRATDPSPRVSHPQDAGARTVVGVVRLRRAAVVPVRRGRPDQGRTASWRSERAGRGGVGGRWCARRTGGGQPVEVRRKEGVTDHLHPESCAGRCEAAGEALTGARTGGAIEHRKQEFWSAETVTAVEGHTDITATGEGMKGSTVSKNPSTSVRPSPGPGRSSFRPGSRTGAAEERRFRNR